MNRPSAEHGPVPPTVREVADLAARLRSLRGRDVDPAERAAFLADKEALIARITGSPPARQGVTLDEATVAADGPDVDEEYVAMSRGEVPLAERVAALHGRVVTGDMLADLPEPCRTESDVDVDGDAGWSR